ncbi:MAG: formylglycine-generating enzyme family protein [Candidatus Aminicenantes bacterium]|nr:MAG: formylglycine-generating enzyme family protein [Candidatus Aminicenantes bacterium]
MHSVNQDNGKFSLPFDGFLAYLRRQGFIIGVDHHLRLQQLLNSLSPDCQPTDLKYLVCPIFATSEKQQQQFYRAFDAYFKFPEIAIKAPKKSAPEKLEKRETVESIDESVTPPKWHYILLGILLLIMIPLISYQLGHAPESTIEPPINESGKPPITETPSDNIPSQYLEKLIAFFRKYQYIFQWVGLLFPFIILLLMEGYKYNRRRLILVKQRGKKPPFVWPVKVETPGTDLVKNKQFYQAARFLRQRLTSDITCLDINKTIAGTINRAGFPRICFRSLTRPPEYLILIDMTAYQDHYSHLCDSIVTALINEGLYVNRYFYEKDPRICFKEHNGQRVYLSDLKTRYSDSRLIIFGDGEELLDPLTGEMDKWTDFFRAWPERALLTPEPPQKWDMREIVLAKEFILLPASLKGLCALVDHFEMPWEHDLKTWKQTDAGLPLLPPGNEDNVDILWEYLGKDTFQWFCACAVYPELHWDLTLYLGTLPCMPENLVSEENVLRLIRLPWFRTGTMPDELRWALISRLDINKSQAIRTAIIDLLENNPPPKESFAYDTYRLHLVAQRWMLSRKDRKKRKEMLKSLKTITEKRYIQDYILLRFLESAPKSPLLFVLPKQLRKLFYRNSVPWFGFKTGIRLALTVLIAVALFLFFKNPDFVLKTGLFVVFLLITVLITAALFLYIKRPYKDMPPGMPPDLASKKAEKIEKGFMETDFGDGIVMVYIPEGEFTMGSNDYSDEKPPHKVFLDGYRIGKYEVTIKQYMQFVNDTKSHYPEWLEEGNEYYINTGSKDYYKKFASDENCPIVGVSWEDARAYCDWLSNKTGLNFKLPTEAQWEKAARGNDVRKYPWGGREPDETLANFDSIICKTTPVGSYLDGASPYGLVDMAGNVWEWCSDWYDSKYYKNAPKENPPGPKSGPYRVMRGGCWYSRAEFLRCAVRYYVRPFDRYDFVGFRLCQDNN